MIVNISLGNWNSSHLFLCALRSKSSCTPGYKSVIIKISKRINLCSKRQIIAKILTNAEPGKEWHRRRPMQPPQRQSQSLPSLRFEDLEFFIRKWFVLWPNEGTFTHCYHLAVKSWSRNSLPAQFVKHCVEIGYILLSFPWDEYTFGCRMIHWIPAWCLHPLTLLPRKRCICLRGNNWKSFWTELQWLEGQPQEMPVWLAVNFDQKLKQAKRYSHLSAAQPACKFEPPW